MHHHLGRLGGPAKTILGFFFGISLSLLLVSLWGRSVTSDPATLGTAAAEAARAAVVSDRIVDWLAAGLGDQSIPVPRLREALDRVIDTPEGQAAITGFAEEAAGAFAGGNDAFDPRPILRPLLPRIAETLAASGVAIDGARLETAVESLEPLTVGAPQTPSRSGGWSGARAGLRTAALVAAAATLLLGTTLVWWSADRRTALREIAQRVALGGLGFVVMFHLGAWALDPYRGGSNSIPSLRRAGAILLRSNLQVPLIIGALGTVAWTVFRRMPVEPEGVESPASTRR